MSTAARLILIGTLTLGSVAAAHEAHEHASGVVSERADLMKAIAQRMKQSGAMLQGKTALDPDVLRADADFIARSGGTALTDLFPAGGDLGASDALPTIWENWPLFEAYADQMSRLAAAVSQSAGHHAGHRTAPDAGTLGGELLGGSAAKSDLLSDEAIAALAAGPPGPTFEALAKTCGSCHTAFRKSK